MRKRIRHPQEPIADLEAVLQYDRGAKLYMMPLYKHFVWKILRKGYRSGRILDIGTGPGLLPIELTKVKKANIQIVGIDISENMIKKARENARATGVGEKVAFQVAAGDRLPFSDNSFDLVISSASLHHWSDPVAVLDEIQRVAKENGHFIIRDGRRLQGIFPRLLVRFVAGFMFNGHRRRWSKAILAGYTIPEVREIVQRSRLKNWQLKTDFAFLNLCIESA